MNKLGILLMGWVILLVGGLQLMPFGYSLYNGQNETAEEFGISIIIALLAGILLVYRGKNHEDSFSVMEGAKFLFICWWVMAFFGGLPYYLNKDLSGVNAIFDALSCFTTTGVLDLPDTADRAIILWRSLSQWLGGYMVLLLLMTILPGTSGSFGMTFVMSGVIRAGAITLNRINQTAISLLKLYTLVTLAGIFVFYLLGVGMFDGVNIVLVTLSTGGAYVPEDIALVTNDGAIITAMVIMLLVGGNFFMYWQGMEYQWIRIIKESFRNYETRLFLMMVSVVTVIVSLHLWSYNHYNALDSFSNAAFHVLSFSCTNGFLINIIEEWSDVDKFFLSLVALIGGCMGSLAGGFKIFRLQVLVKSSLAELRRTLHPEMVVHITIDGRPVPAKLIERVLTYFFMFFLCLFLSMLVLSLADLSVQQTMDMSLACLTSTGPMMMFHMEPWQVRQLPDWIKLYCGLLMVVGKVNIFTFVLLVHGVWAKAGKKRW